MQHSDQIDQIATALAKAQGAIPNPGRNREVTVRSDKGNYKFKYATLDAIVDVVRAPLAANGLAFTQSLGTADGGKMVLTTLLTHASGQWLRCDTPVMVEGAGMQRLGSAQSYARRYAISSLLGIATDEDDDANSADGNVITESRDRRNSSNSAPRAPLTPPAPVAPPAPAAAPKSREQAWADQRLAELDKDMTVDELEAWHQKHRAALEKLHQQNHDLAMRVTERYNERWKLPPMAAA